MDRRFDSYTHDYKRHLTIEQANEIVKNWVCEGDDERRTAKILFRRKTGDYTVVCCKHYNS